MHRDAPAAAEFAERGYAAATVSRIAGRAPATSGITAALPAAQQGVGSALNDSAGIAAAAAVTVAALMRQAAPRPQR